MGSDDRNVLNFDRNNENFVFKSQFEVNVKREEKKVSFNALQDYVDTSLIFWHF